MYSICVYNVGKCVSGLPWAAFMCVCVVCYFESQSYIKPITETYTDLFQEIARLH